MQKKIRSIENEIGLNRDRTNFKRNNTKLIGNHYCFLISACSLYYLNRKYNRASMLLSSATLEAVINVFIKWRN